MRIGETQTGSPGNAVQHPDVMKLRQFMSTYSTIGRLQFWLYTEGESAHPVLRSDREGHLNSLLLELGIEPDAGATWRQLGEMHYAIEERQLHPVPTVEVPEAGFFTARIKEIVQRPDEPEPFAPRAIGRVSLEEVAMYGYTDWGRVDPRGGRGITIGEYVHDIAQIMADPVSYQLHFARADLGLEHANDHMEVKDDLMIFNGRHRSLAAVSLGAEYIAEANMGQWIQVGVGL